MHRISLHLIEVLADRVYINQPGDVLVVNEVPQESDFTQSSLRQRGLLKNSSYQFDRHSLP